MCEGATTIMSCGHALIFYTSYCHIATSRHELRPCTKEGMKGPLQSIDDTCARCHPPFLIAEINHRHNEFRSNKMAQLRRAETREEALALQRVLEEAHAARGKELRAAGQVRWNGMVLWGPPGVGGEPREECESEFPFWC